MSKRLVIQMDDINKIKKLNVGDEFSLRKEFRFSGKKSILAIDHLHKNMPLGKPYWVAEDISMFHPKEGDRACLWRYQDGYSADFQEYALKGWTLGVPSYSASGMPKAFSRFLVQAVEYEKIYNDSTSWFSAYIRFKIVKRLR